MQLVTLVRHGQASYGAVNYDNLSDLGHSQTLALGKAIAEQDICPDVLLSGGMQRHIQTAHNIAAALPISLENQTYPAFNEFAFREVVDSFLALYPAEMPAPDAPRTAFYRVLKLAMQAWSREELGELTESYQGFQMRVVHGIQQIQLDFPNAKHIMVSTSGGAIAMYLGYVLGLTAEKTVATNLQIYNSSLHRFLVSDDTSYLTGFNDIAYLHTQPNMMTYS